ncbi:MAG: aspartate-semialdehyde dehydrogenase, partial [Candidatus Cloacimonetes bacterium]|nr:aspartate-semialdehyde dehydrogenase [Candidatus Cloacimonadota bacterium]
MKIAIVGATGTVGRMMLQTLEEERVLISELALFASEKSANRKITFNNIEYPVQELSISTMKEHYDYILMSAGALVAKEFAPIAAQAGNTIIDNSSAFRSDPRIPLIVPEINGELLLNYRGIVANPNCSTIQMVLALHPLAVEFGLNKVIVSTYQSVSGAGNKGISELKQQKEGSSKY